LGLQVSLMAGNGTEKVGKLLSGRLPAASPLDHPITSQLFLIFAAILN